MEREGYTVRHKLSQEDIAGDSHPDDLPGWVTLQVGAMQTLYKRHRAMALAAVMAARAMYNGSRSSYILVA